MLRKPFEFVYLCFRRSVNVLYLHVYRYFGKNRSFACVYFMNSTTNSSCFYARKNILKRIQTSANEIQKRRIYMKCVFKPDPLVLLSKECSLCDAHRERKSSMVHISMNDEYMSQIMFVSRFRIAMRVESIVMISVLAVAGHI